MYPDLPQPQRQKRLVSTSYPGARARQDHALQRRKKKRGTVKLVRRALFSLSVIVTLVGCTLIGSHVRQSQGEQASEATAARPGPGPITIEARNNRTARVSWYSPWRGTSTVFWGLTPQLDSSATSQTTENQQIQLTGLTPGMRYYLQVQTQTSVGLARSPVCSFIAE